MLGDCLDLMKGVADASVDMILTDLPIRNDIPSAKVIELYSVEGYTLRRIAKQFSTDHHTISRLLKMHDVTVDSTRKPSGPKTDIQKAAYRNIKRKPRLVKVRMSEAQNRANQKRKMKTDLDLSKYEDFDRLKFLTAMTSRHHKHLGHSDESRSAFLEKFWHDEAFNAIYDRWIASGRNKWWMPSLDHKQPRSRKGGWDLGNLQMLTWFENRAKAEMTCAEWQEFKKHNNTTSELFIETILERKEHQHGEQHREDVSDINDHLGRCA
jgi:hypothetical protein